MVALYELIELLPDNYNPAFTGRQLELYTFLKEQKRKLSEDEATLCFLGKEGQRKYFNKLKNNLKQDLVQHIIRNPVWVDFAHKKLYESCYMNFTAYKILLMNGKRSAAIEMAKTLLIKLKKSEIHSLLHIVAMDLHLYYSSINIIPSLSKKYELLADKQLEFINAEALVRKYHNQVSIIKNSRESFTPAMLKVFGKACEETLPFLKLGSNDINRFIYNIVITRYMADFDYKKVIEYSTEAYNSYPSDHPNHKTMRFGYIQMKLLPLVALGRLDEAKTLAKESCRMPTTGGFNWHFAFIRRCFICLHAGDYQEAYELYKEQAKRRCPFPALAEYWKIIWGYLYFLIKTNNIKEYSEERFHLGKFLNEMPIYSKDKAGNNINLLIIQILTRMYRGEFGQIIDRIEALNTYARTYTKTTETKRANLFINMLIKMEAASFHRAATERKTKRLLEKLKNTPLRLGQNLAIEIIPYEIIWEEVLNLLENKIYKLKRTNISNFKQSSLTKR